MHAPRSTHDGHIAKGAEYDGITTLDSEHRIDDRQSPTDHAPPLDSWIAVPRPRAGQPRTAETRAWIATSQFEETSRERKQQHGSSVVGPCAQHGACEP